MVRNYWPALATLALLLSSSQSATLAEDAPMCHDMPMRQKTLDSGKTYLNENGGPRRNYLRSEPGSIYKEAKPREVTDFKPSDFPRSNLPHRFAPQDYRNLSKLSQILIDAAENEQQGYYKEAYEIYKSVLLLGPIFDINKLHRALALEGETRTKILLSSQSAKNFKSPAKQLMMRLSDVARYHMDYALLEQSIVQCDLSEAELKEASDNYCEALKLSPSASAEFTLALIEEKQGHLEAAADRLIAFAKSNPVYTDRVAPFFSRHPQLVVSKKTELEPVIPQSKAELQITYLRCLDPKTLSAQDKTILRSLIDNLSTLDGKLSQTSIEYILKNSTQEQRKKVIAYFKRCWLDRSTFSAQAKPVLDSMRNNNWSKERTTLLASYPQVTDNDCFIKAIILARYCGDNKEFTYYLDQVHCALEAVKVEYREFEKQSKEAETLQKVIALYPAQKAQTLLIAQEAHRYQSDSAEQVRKRQCLEMASKLSDTAFDLEKQDHYKKAAELYQSALEIKQINLDKGDPEIACQMIDVARAYSCDKQYPEADKFFRQAISLLKANKHASHRDLQVALESYGQALNGMDKADRAEAIYKEARQLAKDSGPI